MTETMSLTGGINMYSFEGRRCGSNTSPKGRKVYFLNDNGYESEREFAREHFKPNEILTVEEIYVGRSSSQVEFVEHPGKRFNTVMFTDA
ncbi:hypothetical protein MOD24_17255 [Bacillus haynesii]|uniref:hypothetical protein n=1 Tax=Bacillus haynesii TaxID=1925021 RepID=UPI00227EE30A|nr:hypothetical protein [Bacillus haynesii]MCY8577595.1 hypothetical protein [Bacillus haynesii]MEC1657059.1 hypothetical protein [Bacillus haynesii]